MRGKVVSPDWARLAGACLNARDELRALLPALDAAIVVGGDPPLRRVRHLAAHHADALRLALKHPTGGSPRQSADSGRFQPLWGVSGGGGGGRYREPERRGLPRA